MTELWIGLIVLTLIAMLFLFWPLLEHRATKVKVDREKENIDIFHQRLAELQSEQEQGFLSPSNFNELKLELEKNLLNDAVHAAPIDEKQVKSKASQWLLVASLCVMLPALSLVFYAKYGHYEQLAWNAENRVSSMAQNQQPTFEQAVELLEKELQKTPENPEGWYVLAGHYMQMGAFEKGAAAFLKVTEYLPETSPQYASVVGQYAQALFFINNKVTAQVKEQIDIALKLDSQEVVSLGLLGIEAFESSAYQAAIDYWEKSLINAQPSAKQALLSGIEKARTELEKLGQKPKTDQKTANESKLKVVVDVEIASDIKKSVAKDATLFIFARPVGGKIPLAAVKLTVAELPKRISLDDSLAMLPSATISMHKQVEISARVSLSGQPQAQIGDYQSEVLTVDVSSNNRINKLLINNKVK